MSSRTLEEWKQVVRTHTAGCTAQEIEALAQRCWVKENPHNATCNWAETGVVLIIPCNCWWCAQKENQP